MRRHRSSQRDRGQLFADSWAARFLARLGGAVLVAVIAWSLLGSATASAASHSRSADPSPQPAPTAVSSTPAPDPAPQVAVRAQPSHSTPPTTTRSVSTAVAPRVAQTTAPASTAPASSGPTVSSSPAKPRPPASHHARPVSHAPPHHAAPRRTVVHPISLSFLLGLLPANLLHLPHAALHAGEASRSGGVLLLLSSVAMGVLAVASFVMMRRLKRLAGPA
jgi:hypothetical protein